MFEEKYKLWLTQGEAQFQNLNFLIDVDVLKKCRKKLIKHYENVVLSSHYKKVNVFLASANIVIKYVESQRAKNINENSQKSGVTQDASVSPPDLSHSLVDVIPKIISDLSLIERKRLRSTCQFWKARVDESEIEKGVCILPHDYVLDVDNLCRQRSGKTIKYKDLQDSVLYCQNLTGSFFKAKEKEGFGKLFNVQWQNRLPGECKVGADSKSAPKEGGGESRAGLKPAPTADIGLPTPCVIV